MTEENKNFNIKEELDRAFSSFASAEILYKSGQYNDAVSRLYYALFHTIKALLLSGGIEPKSHEGALTLFTKHFVKPGIFTTTDSHIFSRLMKYRIEADYSPSYLFTKEDYEEFKTDYDSLLKKIRSFLKTKGYI